MVKKVEKEFERLVGEIQTASGLSIDFIKQNPADKREAVA